MSELSRAEVEELFERSKNDRAIIVGSEVRQLCVLALRALCQSAAKSTCNPHPDAPHGFDRQASHAENRYVCECEGWEQPK